MQYEFATTSKTLTQKELEKREMVFKNILYEIINKHHQEFLSNNPKLAKFNPLIEKTWHSNFNLEKLPDIPCYSLINNNKQENATSVSEFIKSKDIKSMLINDAFEKLKHEKLHKQDEETAASKEFLFNQNQLNNLSNSNISENSFLSKFLSKDLIKKVLNT